MDSNNTVKIATYLILSIFIFVSGCAKEKEKPKQEPGRLVKTTVVGKSSAHAYRSYPGSVVASDKVDLAFQVSGPLIELPIDEGQEVKKGQLLAHIDPRDFKNRLDAEQAELHKAKLNFDRGTRLLASGTIPVATYDETRATHQIAVARVSTAKKALDDTYLRAPFDGVVAKKYVENFENVRAKQKILSFQDIGDIDIIIDLPEQDLVHAPLRNGKKRELAYKHYIVFGALTDRKYQAKLKEFVTEADPITQTFKITLTMPAPKDVNILPGMTATFNIRGKLLDSDIAFKIPVNAVAIDEKGQHYVWLVDKKSMTVNRKDVQVGNMAAGEIRVLKGIKTGEEIVTAGTTYLQPGEKVRIYKPKSKEHRL